MYLQSNGAVVKMSDDPNRADFRAARGIPDSAAGCHTAVVDEYALEGHVPAGAIQRLIAERPSAAGLAVPGMPADAPGMGGNATTWASQAVVLVGHDASLTPYSY